MIDALTLDQLRVFAAVADTGSFRAAARRLSRVQSAVSHAIANVEAQLGVTLFDRSGHRPVITPEGEALLANARDILLRVDALRARAQGLGEGVELELSVAVDTLFPISAGGRRPERPARDLPLGLRPRFGAAPGRSDGTRCWRSHTLGIIAGEHFRNPHIAMQALSSVQMVAVVGAAHALAGHMSPTRPGASRACGSRADRAIRPFHADPGARLRGAVAADLPRQRPDAKHALIVAGVGWGRLPLWLVGDLAERPPAAPAHRQPGTRQPGGHRDLSGSPHRPTPRPGGPRPRGRAARRDRA